jgi:hypothetical protein
MALRRTILSDASGEPIPEGTGARVRVTFWDDRPDMRADLGDEEIAALMPWARPVDTRPGARRTKRRKR